MEWIFKYNLKEKNFSLHSCYSQVNNILKINLQKCTPHLFSVNICCLFIIPFLKALWKKQHLLQTFLLNAFAVHDDGSVWKKNYLNTRVMNSIAQNHFLCVPNAQ